MQALDRGAVARAEECKQAMLLATDLQQKAALELMRDLWMGLANQTLALSKAQWAVEFAALETLHTIALGLARVGIIGLGTIGNARLRPD